MQHMTLLIIDILMSFSPGALIFQDPDLKDMVSKYSYWTEAYEFRMQLDSESLWFWWLDLVQGI